MKRTVLIRLDESNLLAFGVAMVCCGMRHFIMSTDAEALGQYVCCSCRQPLVAISPDGRFFFVGEQAIKRGVNGDEGQLG